MPFSAVTKRPSGSTAKWAGLQQPKKSATDGDPLPQVVCTRLVRKDLDMHQPRIDNVDLTVRARDQVKIVVVGDQEPGPLPGQDRPGRPA